MKKKKINILNSFFIILGIIIFIVYYYSRRTIHYSIEQLIFTLETMKGVSYSSISGNIIDVVILIEVVVIVYLGFICVIKKILRRYPNIIPINDVFKTVISICLFIIITGYCLNKIELFSYIKAIRSNSDFIENNYVDGKNVKLEFPKNKKNLIYIFVESLETSNVSIKNGGSVNKSYTPNLERIALDNLNFSNTDKLGGAYMTTNSSWTMAGLIGETAGIPLGVDIRYDEYYGDTLLPGVYNLGDILLDNGYHNYLMLGSDSNFGSRNVYFESHGDYTIYDYYSAINDKIIPEDYYVWWGFEDSKLFDYAKVKLTEIAKNSEPFNFTMLTSDTHFTDGYLEDTCPNDIFDSQYANVFYCEDLLINSFIEWIQEQDFYKDTTIIIMGDHLTMQNNFYDDSYDRVIYNSIINSSLNTDYSNNRKFNSLDMYPTTLASLGVNIEGDRLGLGTNLYSGKKTLIEEYGLDYFNKEVRKSSDYYNKQLLKK